MVVEIQQAKQLIDAGILRRPDETFISALVDRADRGMRMTNEEMVRLRKILDENG